jgi:hypothetical protein
MVQTATAAMEVIIMLAMHNLALLLAAAAAVEVIMAVRPAPAELAKLS